MEKPLVQSEQETPAPQSLPTTTVVHRKPVPAATTKTASETKSQPPVYIDTVTLPEHHSQPPTLPSKSSLYNSPLPPLPPQRTFIQRLSTRFSSLPKRTRYLILAALLLALLTFIIGLSAGLATRNNHFKKNLPLPTSHGGPWTGDLTYYDPGLGACGITSTSTDYIVAVSHLVFDAAAVSQGSTNPNANPLCGKMIRAQRGGVSVDLRVVDRCTGCKSTDLDVTRTVFAGLADIDLGRVPVSWAWLENVPAAAAADAST